MPEVFNEGAGWLLEGQAIAHRIHDSLTHRRLSDLQLGNDALRRPAGFVLRTVDASDDASGYSHPSKAIHRRVASMGIDPP
jgi:hypothetical protein